MTKAKTPAKAKVSVADAAPTASAASATNLDGEGEQPKASSVGEASAEAVAVKTVPGIRVASRPDNFRRAGIAFTAEAQDLKLADLSPSQIEAIRGERNLVVVDCQIPV